VLDFGRDPELGTPYLVMELLRGELLQDRIAKGKLPPYEAVLIARGVLSALRHAHGLDLVHRDVKPGNILMAEVGETAPLIKLLDFGLAKSVAEDSPDVREPLTALGMVFGTPGYLSPEQAAGKQADARSDLYALGAVLFEMVCGRLPFERAETVDVLRDHLLTPPPSPRSFTPSVSMPLERVILKALAKDPSARFQTAEEILTALAACPEASTASLPVPAPAAPLTVKMSRLAASGRRLGGQLRPLVEHGRRLMRGHRRSALLGTGAAALLVLLVAWIRTPPLAPARASAPASIAPGPISVSARRHIQLAEGYQQKLWCADAIDELERALHEAPALRANPDLTRTAIPCLRAKTQARTVQFLVGSIGVDARAELEAALAGELKSDVRDGAQKALARLAGPP